ncbi:MAG TPA: CPBP family intramembrane glutamic endopeptidase [Flavobacteriaceae bacterium]|nr:CPBP family intramembrane glutamic endopeptidase [Flavobacteriaceae bacterium]
MINQIIGTILQILIFILVPFVVYLIRKKNLKGFLTYIGLKKSNRKANFLAVLTSLVFLTPMLILTVVSEPFREIMFDPNSTTGNLRTMNFNASAIITFLIIAIFRTFFAEEILFRGFIAKRLISVMGFQKGNSLQALIFGIVHVALFTGIATNLVFLGVIFVFPTITAYIFGYLNEKKANGSIVPGWIAHALANTITYIFVGFII